MVLFLLVLLTLALGVGVVAVVAWPHLRRGEPLLTAKGDELVFNTAQRARKWKWRAKDAASELATRTQEQVADLRQRAPKAPAVEPREGERVSSSR